MEHKTKTATLIGVSGANKNLADLLMKFITGHWALGISTLWAIEYFTPSDYGYNYMRMVRRPTAALP